MLGDEVWLVGERRSTGEQKYDVSNLPPDTTLKTLFATINGRWVCEQAHQQRKEKLGLGQFEGRSSTGLHRHARMTMIAYAFLQSRRIKAAGRQKESRDRRHNRPCRPSVKPSSISSHGLRPCDVLAVRSLWRKMPTRSAKVMLTVTGLCATNPIEPGLQAPPGLPFNRFGILLFDFAPVLSKI